MDSRLRELERMVRSDPEVIPAYINAWNNAGRPYIPMAVELFLLGCQPLRVDNYENNPLWEDLRGHGKGKKAAQREARQAKRRRRKWWGWQ